MSIHERAKRLTLAVLCACGLLAAGAAVVVPASALAACAETTGSGSTLQTTVQQALIPEFKAANGVCGHVELNYNKPSGTGSGKGLEEFGMQNGNALVPADSANGVKLDGFIGTDDPPTSANLTQGKEAAGTNPITVPVLAAPIAVVLHLAPNCAVSGTPFRLTNQELDLLFRHQQTWQQLDTQLGLTDKGAECETAKPIVEVRSDKSGTSFAFKQYLSQIKSVVWTKFVSDEVEWPESTQAKTTHIEGGKVVENKGSSGEALAVVETPNSIGYVNAADAHNNGIKAWHNNQDKVFWAEVQNNGLETVTKEGAEPVKVKEGKTVGNCPSGTYTFASEALKKAAEGKPPVWAGVELAKISTEEAYPLCTFTYDVAWEKYETEKLKGATEYGSIGKSIGETTKTYLEFLLGTGQTDIAKGLPEYYSALPTNIDTIAKSAVATITP